MLLFYHVGYKNSEPEAYGTYPMFAHVVLNNIATVKDFMFSRNSYSIQDVGCKLIAACQENKPDAVFMSIQTIPSIFSDLTVLLRLKEMSVPVVLIWVDTVYDEIRYWLEHYNLHVALSVIIDDHNYLKISPFPERILPLFSTCKSTQKYDVNFDCLQGRDIDVSFVGTINGYKERQEALSYLRDEGVSVFCCGWQDYPWGSVQGVTYENVWLRSKITLNFTMAKSINRHQMKGRGFEAALSGAMLLETVNDCTPYYFKPDAEFVMFNDFSEMVSKIKYYLSNDQERGAIAKMAYETAHGLYTDEMWWNKMLEKLAKLGAVVS